MISALSILLIVLGTAVPPPPDPSQEVDSPGDGLGLVANRPRVVSVPRPFTAPIPPPAAGLGGMAAAAGALAGLASGRLHKRRAGESHGAVNEPGRSYDGDLAAILGIHPGEEVLLLEPGHDGRIAVRIGPADAEHIAIYVPGTGADLMGTSVNLERARILRQAATQAAGGDTVAVIYALPFDAPDEIIDIGDPFGPDSATMDTKARIGSVALTEFVDSLDLDHADVTIVAHSYGSTVVGHALSGDRLAEHVDRVVFVGSPGVGVSRADDLNLDDVYAIQSGGDVINNVPPLETALLLPFLGPVLAPPAAVAYARVTDQLTHGLDPTAERFGATVLDSGDFGHAEYFDSVDNVRPIAEVVAGKTP